MRVAVHDYSGHPFQIQLSRELARRGHDVCHLHCSSFVTGKGALDLRTDDPATLRVEAIDLGATFEKYSLWKRLGQERRYARLLAERVSAFRPNVVLSSNTPLFAQRTFLRALDRKATAFVFWQQDVYSVAMSHHARKRIPVFGAALAAAFERLERSMLEQSDEIVVISSDFCPILERWGIPPGRITVIENWAPLSELSPMPRHNAWSSEHGLDESTVILYSGTLGLKHNPELLSRLAARFSNRSAVRVVVVSEGMGADYLANAKLEHGLDNLVLLPFQPYERFSEVLGSADVVVAILEPEAGVFSVPSKVLSYHCAGRPILGAIPAENLAARIIARVGSGVVTNPTDVEAFADRADQLVSEPELRSQMAHNARRYAEQTFDIVTIADRFETILDRASTKVHDHA